MAPTPTTNHTIASANSPSDPMLKLRDLLSSIQPPSAASPQNSKGHDHDEEDAVAVVATEVEVEVEVQQGDGSSKEDRMLDLSVLKYGDLIVFRSMSCNRNVSCRVPDGSGKCVAESELYQAEVEGFGLGGRQLSELLVLESAKVSTDPELEQAVIRYNDTVIIRSLAADHQALSVHNSIEHSRGKESPSHPLIGFYRTWTSYSENFSILASDTDTNYIPNTEQGQCSPVCIGDVIVLRSASTGDILQVQPCYTTNNSHTLVMGKFETEKNDISSSGRFQIGKSNQALNPAWLTHSKKCSQYLYDDYLRGGHYKTSKEDIILPTDLSAQETLVLEHLIDALMGFPGKIFDYQLKSGFDISSEVQNIDISLAHLSRRILPLCGNYVFVDSFISARLTRYEHGLVAQALASAMNNFVQEYLLLVNQFETFLNDETKTITLQKLWCFIQPSLSTMKTLANISELAENLKGGSLLNMISSSMNCTADDQENKILSHLLNASSVPYFNMLCTWLYSGKLNDAYNEFMVCDNTQDVKDEDTSIWWAGQFTLLEDNVLDIFRSATFNSTVPSTSSNQTRSSFPHKILTTGKYLSVIRECSQLNHESQYDDSVQETIEISEGILSVHSKIHSAFNKSSSMLLSLLFDKYELVHKMRSIIKRYFLLHHQGPDFFTQFLDAAESELLLEVDDISPDRIKSLLSMAGQSHNILDSNGQQLDLFREDFLFFDFAPLSLIDHLDALHSISGGLQLNDVTKNSIREVDERILNASKIATPLTGIEAFTLDFRANSLPLSLMISRRAITNYQLIFRHLFFCKHVERRLFSTWIDHQMTKELNLRVELGKTYCLRQRMLHFLQNFVYYMMFEVIGPHWHEFENNLSMSKNIDDAMRVHEDFQHVVMKECLLTNQGLLKVLAKLMSTCLLFSEQMRRFYDSTNIDNDYNESATNERLRRFNTESNRSQKVERQKIIQATMERRRRLQSLNVRLKRELCKTSYTVMIAKFHQVFDSLLSDFMDELEQDANANYHSHLSNLAVRLDYNHYYSTRQ